MAWKSIADRLNAGSSDPDALPLVLAGPILRKTTSNEVSVWIALKKSATVTLKIYEKSAYDAGTIQEVMSGIESTYQLGDHLHVINVKALGTALAENTIYYYDIIFENVSGYPDNTTTLLGNSVLKNNQLGDGILNYPDHALPSFLIPTSDLNKLKVVHGSCRKPHGGENAELPDALAGLDQMLYITSIDTDDRPHQLVLTGDQIYSDDVAEVLLFMIEDAAKHLINIQEDFQNDFGVDLSRHKLIGKTSFRKDIVKISKLTSKYGSYGHYHLMKLGEFYSMYLFAWSDVLWGDNDLPTFSNVRPGISTSYQMQSSGPPGQSFTYTTEKKSNFDDTLPPIKRFRETLPGVRRALANIPVYMMFDDHEVTDDWFLNLKWCEDMLGNSTSSGSPLAKRIFQNGLAAFGVFQAWGNTPDYFSIGNPGGKLLDDLEKVSTNPSNINALLQTIQGDIIPNITYDYTPQFGSEGSYLTGGLDWHYTIRFGNHQLIAIDPRTKRGFEVGHLKWRKRIPCSLLSDQALIQQFSGAQELNDGVTFLLSPAPVIGHPDVEWWQRNINPNLNLGEHISSKNDQEAWSLNIRGFNNILLNLVPHKYVVMLSGDVHYAFSATTKFWDNRIPGDEKAATMVQLTSSSLKNRTVQALYATTESLGKKTSVTDNIHYFLGYEGNQAWIIHDDSRSVYLSGNPTAYHKGIPKEDPQELPSFTPTPHWQFKYFFHNDDRLDSDRGTYNDANIVYPTGVDRHKYAINQKRRYELGARTAVVGTNNIGLVKLTWFPDNKKVHHLLWFNLGGIKLQNTDLPGLLITDLFNPYTIHDIEDFNLPLSEDKPHPL